MSIIAVRICVLGAPEKENVSHVMAEELLQFPERFMEHVRRCSRELIDCEGILTYMDGDGDACTLTSETLQDALCFLEHSQEMPLLQLVVKPGAATADSQQAPAVVAEEPSEKRPKLAVDSQVPCATSGWEHSAPQDFDLDGFNEWDKGAGKGFGKCLMKGMKGLAKGFGKAFGKAHHDHDWHAEDSDFQGFNEWGKDSGKGFGKSFMKGMKGLAKGFWKASGKPHHGHDWQAHHGHDWQAMHHGIVCDGCEMSPIVGVRYRSLTEDNFDLCEQCYKQRGSESNYEALASPWDTWAQAKGQWFRKGMGKGKCGWGRHGWGSTVFDLGGGVTSEVVHENVTCDGCGTSPICGTRYKSLERADYDLCQVCHDRDDREAICGVASTHRFQQIPEAPQASDSEQERLKGVLSFVQSCGIDLKQLLPRAAAACLGALEPVQEDEDRMVPLIEKLTALSEMTELSLDQATAELHDILSIIRSFHWRTQSEIFTQAGFALHGLLAELGVEADLFKGAHRSHGCGWWNRHMLKMFKGIMKGKCGKGRGKGSWVVSCDGCGACPLTRHFRSLRWSNYDLCETCYSSPDKDQRLGADHPFEEMQSGWRLGMQHSADAPAAAAPASPEDASARAAADAVCQDALEALLGSENAAVRKAAEEALAKAKAAQPAPEAAEKAPEPAAAAPECCAMLCGDPSVELLSAVDYDHSPVGDVSREWASVLAQFPRMRRAYHFGRVRAAAGAALALRLCMANTSEEPWPASTVLRIAAGPAQGLPELHVGALGPGDVAELELRLLPQSSGRSSWSLEADGEPFGPLLILDAV